MSKLRGSGKNSPNESSIHWDYFLSESLRSALCPGDFVLVEYYGRARVAIITGRVPGGCHWARLVAPVSGQSRVIVSKHSLVAVAKNAQ